MNQVAHAHSSQDTENTIRVNFWQKYPLQELNRSEWEALCDGCGMCCLIKFWDDGDDIIYTDIACQLLDCTSGLCSSYTKRHDFVPECITLTYDALVDMMWLPHSCAYKRLYLGLDLPEWHVLLTKDKELSTKKMRLAGIGSAGRCISEHSVDEYEMEERIVNWVI